jgi:hypothetical protein
MAIQKRRVVYLSDEDWNELKKWARTDGTTISETLRGTINIVRRKANGFGYSRPAPKP